MNIGSTNMHPTKDNSVKDSDQKYSTISSLLGPSTISPPAHSSVHNLHQSDSLSTTPQKSCLPFFIKTGIRMSAESHHQVSCFCALEVIRLLLR